MFERTCDCGVCKTCRHREYMRNWARTAKGKVVRRRAMRAYLAESPQAVDPVKRRARKAVELALANGRLRRGPCAQVSEGCHGRIEGHHHHGYDAPLDVEWLCATHHHLTHDDHVAPG